MSEKSENDVAFLVVFFAYETIMTPDAFIAWAAKHGLPTRMTEKLILLAATSEEMKAAYEETEPAPPIQTLDDIVAMTENDYFGTAAENGFVFVGGCPNGDPIAIDVADDLGSVRYIPHEDISDRPIRQTAIRVFEDVDEMMKRYGNDGFPYDYDAAKEQLA